MDLQAIMLIANDLTDGMIIADCNGKIRIINKKAREIGGIPYTEVLADQPVLSLREKIHETEELYKAACGGGQGYKNKVRTINSYRVQCSIIRLAENGVNLGALLKLEDVTHQTKLRDEKFDLLYSLKKQVEITTSDNTFPNLIGESGSFRQVKHLAYRASLTNSTVLLLGESGTGKSFLAENIHKVSARRNQPFICLNCGAVPENLLESELFGYEEGAFTGARREGRAGFFELANRGTIFLDEIGDMSPSMQSKLLTVIQEKKFMRIGGGQERTVDVKIITATNRDLRKMVEEGGFRSDLFYRINVFPIYIPPLRERKEDIYLLIHALIPVLCKRIGADEKWISSDAITCILAYDWPGNIRQLENILERAINICEGSIITRQDLHIENKDAKINLTTPLGLEIQEVLSLKQAVDDFERNYIKQVLALTRGDKQVAMEKLKIAKTTFYNKLHEYNLK